MTKDFFKKNFVLKNFVSKKFSFKKVSFSIRKIAANYIAFSVDTIRITSCSVYDETMNKSIIVKICYISIFVCDYTCLVWEKFTKVFL